MEIYEVGGCVRDRLLGKDPKDIDYVVVGSSPEKMTALGYHQVGKDFPVYLHPVTQDEYALARTERKTGNGYNGFTVNSDGVTLEEDLYRRDLTMNAMAMDKNGNLIDPYGGADDLKGKIIRHVSPHFAEDPLRVLRAARFAARYEFTIAPETLTLMKELSSTEEFKTLVKERIWVETEKVFNGGGDPSIYFKYLMEVGALEPVYKVPSVDLGKIKEVSQSNASAEDKFKMLFLLVYSNPEVIQKVETFDVNEINWEEYGNKPKPVMFANRSMYAPSSLLRLRDQFGAVINFGVYHGKPAEDRLQLIRILRASQNKDDVSFVYNAMTAFTRNELMMDVMQVSKEVFLSDVNELDNINYKEILEGCPPKEISVRREQAQLEVLRTEPEFTRSVIQEEIKYNGHIKHTKPTIGK